MERFERGRIGVIQVSELETSCAVDEADGIYDSFRTYHPLERGVLGIHGEGRL
jgi:hypothetical protein